MFKKHFYILKFLIVLASKICSQNLDNNWIIIYDKANLKVEIKFDIHNNGCTNNGYPTTYSYRYNGLLLNNENYVNWKIDYINCNGMFYTLSDGVELGGYKFKKELGLEKIEDQIKENFDDQITTKKIISNRPYDVTIGYSKIKSNKESIFLPKNIQGKNKICKGDIIKLYINENETGNSIKKFEWYRGSCEKKNLIGTGNYIKVRPIRDTKYYLRAITKGGTKSKCLEKNIIVYEQNTTAKSILSSKNKVCEGDLVKLTAIGETKGNWIWKNQDQNSIIGKGSNITLKPKDNINVELYSDNEGCNKSSSIFENIEVLPKSKFSEISTNYDNKRDLYLKLENASLAEDSKFYWYYDKNDEKKLIKSGKNEIIYPKNKNTTYYAVSKGGICDKNDYGSVTVNNLKKITTYDYSKRTWNYANVDPSKKNHSHFGFSIGYSGLRFIDSIESTNINNNNESHAILNNGIIIGINFHPIIRKKFSLGLYGDYSNDFILLKQRTYEKNDLIYLDDNSFQKINFGIETAGGFEVFKLLIGYNIILFDNNLNISVATGTKSNYNIFKTLNLEEKIINQSLKLGFRIGSYDHKNDPDETGNIIDFSIVLNKLTRNKNLNFNEFIDNHNNIENWNPGINISWWKHRWCKLGIDAIYYDNYRTLNINTIDFNKLIYQLKFTTSLDKFK